MVARSIEKRIAGLLLGSFGIALISLAVLVSIVREFPLQCALVALAAFAAWAVLKSKRESARQEQRHWARTYADEQIDRHRSALISYFRQSIKTDLFGNEEKRTWEGHVDRFIETQITPALSRRGIEVDQGLVAYLANRIDEQVRIDTAQHNVDLDVAGSRQLSAVEYEVLCAEILRQRGWKVHQTPATGDHGADIVAEKNGKRLVVQCKLYGQPVGNKAVQEVYSAQPMYHAGNACVVAPAGFTAHAERAAHALSVRLLNHRDLGAFADELSG